MVELINIKDIKPYEKNPRKNDKAVEAVAASIKEFGFKVPVIIDKNHEIVAGHTRYKAAKKLKIKEIPCIIADDLTDNQIAAFRLAENKTHELSEWDFDLFGDEFKKIIDIDMTAFGFDFEDIFPAAEPEEDDFDVAANVPETPISQLGDLYQLGRHRLMCGDSTDENQIAQLMNGVKADLYISDPPYNVNYEGGTPDKLKISNDNMPDSEFRAFLVRAFANFKQYLKDGGCFYIFHSDSEGYNFRGACVDVGLKIRQCLIWVKNSFVMGRQDYQWQHEPILYGWKDGASHLWASDRKQKTILNFDKPLKNAEHPTMKPIGILAYLIGNNTKGEDVVLDTFGGSGSTMIACEQMNRICYMTEIAPKYCDVIISRWEKFTGLKAEKIN